MFKSKSYFNLNSNSNSNFISSSSRQKKYTNSIILYFGTIVILILTTGLLLYYYGCNNNFNTSCPYYNKIIGVVTMQNQTHNQTHNNIIFSYNFNHKKYLCEYDLGCVNKCDSDMIKQKYPIGSEKTLFVATGAYNICYSNNYIAWTGLIGLVFLTIGTVCFICLLIYICKLFWNRDFNRSNGPTNIINFTNNNDNDNDNNNYENNNNNNNINNVGSEHNEIINFDTDIEADIECVKETDCMNGKKSNSSEFSKLIIIIPSYQEILEMFTTPSNLSNLSEI